MYYNIMFRRKIMSLYTKNTRLRPAWILTERKIKLMFFERQYKNGPNTSRRRCDVDDKRTGARPRRRDARAQTGWT